METNGRASLFDLNDDEPITRRDVALELPPEAPDYLRALVASLRARERLLMVGQEGVSALHGKVGAIGETVGSIEKRVVKLESKLVLLMALAEVLRSLVPDGAGKALVSLLGVGI